MSASSCGSSTSAEGSKALCKVVSTCLGRDSIIAGGVGAKYEQIDALRELMRRDDRFEWVELPNTGSASNTTAFTRRRGVAAEAIQKGDESLRALLESDSIPQYIWPAAGPLQQWINAHGDLFASRTVLELGCGTGVVGITAARYAKLVVLTDSSAVSLAMTLESITRNNLSNCCVAPLSWGREDQMDLIKEACNVVSFDIVIGSDVFYFSGALRSGLATARYAFEPAKSRDAVFLCGSVARSERMEVDLEEIPLQEGFELCSLLADGPFHLYSWKLAAA